MSFLFRIAIPFSKPGFPPLSYPTTDNRPPQPNSSPIITRPRGDDPLQVVAPRNTSHTPIHPLVSSFIEHSQTRTTVITHHISRTIVIMISPLVHLPYRKTPTNPLSPPPPYPSSGTVPGLYHYTVRKFVRGGGRKISQLHKLAHLSQGNLPDFQRIR